MAKIQPQHKVSPRRILAFVVASVVTFLLLVSVISIAGKYFRLRGAVKGLKQQEIALRDKEYTLSTTNAYLETPEGREAVLREKYGVVKPGEGMVVVIPTSVAHTPEQPKGHLVRWWDTILHGLGIRKD